MPVYRCDLKPFAYAIGIGGAREFSPGIEQYNDYGSTGERRLHDQAPTGFIDEAGLRQTDIPDAAAHEAVGVAERNRVLAA